MEINADLFETLNSFTEPALREEILKGKPAEFAMPNVLVQLIVMELSKPPLKKKL